MDSVRYCYDRYRSVIVVDIRGYIVHISATTAKFGTRATLTRFSKYIYAEPR